jgi:hypothetical protein
MYVFYILTTIFKEAAVKMDCINIQNDHNRKQLSRIIVLNPEKLPLHRRQGIKIISIKKILEQRGY